MKCKNCKFWSKMRTKDTDEQSHEIPFCKFLTSAEQVGIHEAVIATQDETTVFMCGAEFSCGKFEPREGYQPSPEDLADALRLCGFNVLTGEEAQKKIFNPDGGSTKPDYQSPGYEGRPTVDEWIDWANKDTTGEN